MTSKEKESLARIDQKLDDFIDTFKTYKESMESRMSKVERLKNKVEQPLKWVGALVTVASIGMFTVVGEKLARWAYAFARHAGR